MAETIFDRAERGLGGSDMSIPDIVAQTKGNPQEIMKLVMGGQINVTQGLLAKRLSDSVIAERVQAQAQSPSVLQEAFPEMAQMAGGLGGMPQAAPQVAPSPPAPAGMQPPMEGGLGGMPLPEGMFAGDEVGGLGSYAAGDEVVEEQETVTVNPYAVPEVNIQDMLATVQGAAPRKTEALTAYKEKVGTPLDFEQERKDAERMALFNALANVKPGTNPFEAFVKGMAGTGQELAQNKKELKKREIEQLKAVAEIEGMENEYTQKDYELAYQLKLARENLLSDVAKNKLQKELSDDRIAAERANAILRAETDLKQTAMQTSATRYAADVGAKSQRDFNIRQAATEARQVLSQAQENLDANPTVANMKKRPEQRAQYNRLLSQELGRIATGYEKAGDAMLAEQIRIIGSSYAGGNAGGGRGGRGSGASKGTAATQTPPWKQNWGS